MKLARHLLLSALVLQLVGVSAVAGAAEGGASSRFPRLDAIDGVVREEIQAGHLPGAVVVVGIGGRIVYRQAFGSRAVIPDRVPMSINTIFDAASLTKVVATTIAIMQLVERRKIDLDTPVAAYWPKFAANGKADITVRELLTHYSGLPPDLPTQPAWSGYAQARRLIAALKPAAQAGTTFVYSDVDFAVLGELVHGTSGLPLDEYCAKYIFGPLRMRDTRFRPPRILRSRIAPADIEDSGLRWGQVQDPMAYRMGGVSGHAGLFTTADDLAKFAEMLLSGGLVDGHRILNAKSVALMTTPQSPTGQVALRGLGWDIDSPYSVNLAPFFSPRSFGHTGYTGTALWIDPDTRSFLIVLSNRLHPYGKGNIGTLLRRVADLAGGAAAELRPRREAPSPLIAEDSSSDVERPGPRRVLTGVDVLEAYGFRSLVGLKLGLITNRSSRDAAGRRTVDVLYGAPGVRLVALLSPEHGLDASADGKVPSDVDSATGLPVYSLYDDVRRPTDAMLDGLDALVFDVQDAGARFYTYATTMAYAMEAAARRRLDFFVLDRPNPITASIVQGPILDPDLTSFVGYMPMPVRHGMTMGELARMFNTEKQLGTKLHVVAMRRYDRALWYDETRLAWVPPSPNLRRIDEAILYPGVAMVEGANVSVGRGTATPFEILGAPWVDGSLLATYLESRNIPGVHFEAIEFTPTEAAFAGVPCRGVRINTVDRNVLDSPLLGIEIISALYRLFGEHLDIEKTLAMIGSRESLDALKADIDPRKIAKSWTGSVDAFLEVRNRYLLY